jgi:signal transduction histidine kinase
VLEYLCIILPLAVLAAAHVLRVHYLSQQLRESLEQRLEDRIRERSRIARDLHDSLLQGFHGMMFRLEAVRRLLPDRPEEAIQHLDVAIDRGLAAISEGRVTVGELRVPGTLGTDLPQALADLGNELGRAPYSSAVPDYRVLVQGRALALESLVRDEVYRIAREAVRNSFRHARARRIEVEIAFAAASFAIRVRDDGVGLEPAILADGQRQGHWGLPGMRERAVELGGELDVWSQLNAGTEIELRIAGRIAYSRQRKALFARAARES